MVRRRLGIITLGISTALAGAFAAGCFTPGEETEDAQGAQVAGEAQSAQRALASVVMLPGGCLGTKVGPKHVLVSARCLIGNDAIAAGKEIRLAKASSSAAQGIVDADEDAPAADAGTKPSDAGSKPSDAGTKPSDAGASADAGKAPTPAGAIDVKLAAVHVNPSFAAKCKTADACPAGSVEASDAPDVALLEADAEISGVLSVPIDLDAVSDADPVFVAAVGCDAAGKAAGSVKAHATTAVAAKSVNHAGSPYRLQPQFTTRLGAAYVVTGGSAWKAGEPSICAADFGGPLFRPGGAAVAGVHSGITTFEGGKLAVTAQHTRLDGTSRFKIGAWLQKLGADTVKTCSETADGCQKRTPDAGTPTPSTDAGATPDSGSTTPARDGGASTGDASAPTPTPDAGAGGDAGQAPVDPTAPPTSGTDTREEQLPTGEDEYTPSSGEDYDPSEVAPKKTTKKKAAEGGGCSAAPGSTSGAAGTWLLAAAAVIIARRRKSAR